jgi:hypothetical protein
VVPAPENADAAIFGEVSAIEANPILFDAATGRATTALITVRLRVRLVERSSQREIYRNDDFLFREQYEISTDIPSFFEEQQPAFDRLSRDFAARLVSALLENF